MAAFPKLFRYGPVEAVGRLGGFEKLEARILEHLSLGPTHF